MASSGQYDQICALFVAALGPFCGYPMVAAQSFGDDGFILDGHPTEPPLRIFKRERDRWRSESPPVITLVPRGGDIVPPDMPGTQRGGLSGAKSESSGVPAKGVAVRQFQIKVHCWGRDFEQAESLLHNALNAFYVMGHNSISFSQEEWPTQADGVDSTDVLGDVVTFLARIDHQVLQIPATLRGLRRVDHVRNTITDGQQTEVQVL